MLTILLRRVAEPKLFVSALAPTFKKSFGSSSGSDYSLQVLLTWFKIKKSSFHDFLDRELITVTCLVLYIFLNYDLIYSISSNPELAPELKFHLAPALAKSFGSLSLGSIILLLQIVKITRNGS